MATLRLLSDVLHRAADVHAHNTALVVGERRFSYAQIAAQAARLAWALRAQGVRRGDRVAVFMDNCWQNPSALFGVLLADAAFVTVNPYTKRDKLEFILRDSGARALLSEQQLARVFMPAVDGVTVFSTGVVAGALPLDEVFADGRSDWPPTESIGLDLAALLYTSGTTGDPKGVMHTHQSLLAALTSINDYLGVRADDRLLCGLPLSFGYGLFQWFSAVHAGASLVLERSFTYPAQVFAQMLREEVTTFAGVPTLYALLLSHDAKQPLRFPSVRLITNAAAALPAEFIAGLQRIFPNAALFKMYGQTECIRIAYLDPARAAQKPESVGGAIPGSEILLLDEALQPVAPGEVGTLYVRGPHVMRGYWNLPEKTAAALRPGPLPGELMLNTGDQFRRDADGDLYFVARSDEIIKSRGEKVSPVEVENAIYRLPQVREVIVLGVPDAVLGQAVCAVVVLREDAQLVEQQVKRICSEHLENYMVPKRVVFVAELPRTANGKLSRKLVAEELGDRLVEPAH